MARRCGWAHARAGEGVVKRRDKGGSRDAYGRNVTECVQTEGRRSIRRPAPEYRPVGVGRPEHQE
jgi:hypothetical protein